MNILLLAAGKGQRFQDKGYVPKPLIKVNGVPMWRAVLNNFLEQFFWPGKTNVYVVTKEEYDINNQIEPYEIVALHGPQYGAAFSAKCAILKLKSENKININEPLLILNCDQFIKYDWRKMKQDLNHWKGALFHFYEPDGETKWGRSIIDELGFVFEIVEKRPESDIAHCGYYYWSKTSDFIKYSEKMISLGIKINGEYFISPIYNLMIEDDVNINGFMVDEFIGIGIPEDLEGYLSGEISPKTTPEWMK